MNVDEVTLGSYPRDDVAWAKDGKVREGRATILVRQSDGTLKPAGEVALGDGSVLHPDVEVGGEFIVELRARFESQIFERRVTFIASGDEASDIFVSAIGPGGHAEPKAGLFKRARYSGFEFGVLVMAAMTEQGTRLTGTSDPLVKHGPGDGVAAVSAT
ncbi:hypothetical protein [Arthrobacter zhaoxinii]|uniref:hypothetical protein n=1 Tax=Arthrobacter zhaoxinii TaxID=2964616 RepID=UPI002103F851|nr:hypothetical protein [Arthrobacter zhaoxinii]MCQ2002198.1 hypothetical protein [Arthrobacter zhaoxinii]